MTRGDLRTAPKQPRRTTVVNKRQGEGTHTDNISWQVPAALHTPTCTPCLISNEGQGPNTSGGRLRPYLPTTKQAAPLNDRRMHTTGQYLVLVLVLANEVWLRILFSRGTNPQTSINLAEYGVVRRRHRKMLRNNLCLHAHIHRKILKYNLDLHAHNNREILRRNPGFRRAYLQKYRSLLDYRIKHFFNPWRTLRHRNLLDRIPPWIPHLA